MYPVLLIDFGSTYTKITALDLEQEALLGTAEAFTTIETNIMDGLTEALHCLKAVTGLDSEVFERRLACSSAAGGLKMVAIGLVKELTAEAACRAALGAGARVLGTYAYELCEDDLAQIERDKPDIILLVGGTDGGERKTILHNAKMLTLLLKDTPIVVSGNRSVAKEAAKILKARHNYVVVTDNVLPELNRLNVDPAREAIRRVFLSKIIEAKGLTLAEKFIETVAMPTPAAVLKAAQLIACGVEGEKGLGDLVMVDIGGATTDVYSIGSGDPSRPGVNLKGLPEPYAKRTVEGDLGMRYSAVSLGEAAGSRLSANLGKSPEELVALLKSLSANPASLPQNAKDLALEIAMAKMCTKLAVERHVGQVETVYTPYGGTIVQRGKDMTEAKVLIGTGGVLVHSHNPKDILFGALFDSTQPTLLAPRNPRLLLDVQYILPAIGLLTEIAPATTLRIAKKYLKQII